MKDQHTKITGYRDLSQEEIDSMNEIKAIGIKLGELVEKLESIEDIDKRWLDAGKLDLQMGIMSIVRSVAKPTVF